jgi:hypothetical protein
VKLAIILYLILRLRTSEILMPLSTHAFIAWPNNQVYIYIPYEVNCKTNNLYFYAYAVLYFRYTHIYERKLVINLKMSKIYGRSLATRKPTLPLKNNFYLKIK